MTCTTDVKYKRMVVTAKHQQKGGDGTFWIDGGGKRRDSLKTEFVYVQYRTNDIFTVTEPGPLGAEIIHQGDVLAMCQTHSLELCLLRN